MLTVRLCGKTTQTIHIWALPSIMSIQTWFQRFIHGDASAPPSVDGTNVEGLDVADVLVAHLTWRSRLERHVRGEEIAGVERLNVNEVMRDDRCVLGRWIYSDQAKAYAGFEFDKLQRAHADFHYYAAKVLHERHARGQDAALRILELEFAQHSLAVQGMLAVLQEVAAKRNPGRDSSVLEQR
jgi:Chemoreceptor zinc-binding domain